VGLSVFRGTGFERLDTLNVRFPLDLVVRLLAHSLQVLQHWDC